MIGLKRKAFMSLRQLVCIKAFGTGPTNTFWPGMGYQGPRTTPEVMQGQHHDPPEQREFDFTPYLLNGKHDTNEVVANRVQSLQFDVVVVGSGCGGAVVVERCAQAGLKVLLVEKGQYYRREELSGSEEAMDKLYERGAMCVTEDTGMAVLAGATFGGGTAVNWACCLEPPRYVREEWAEEHGLTHFLEPSFQKSLDTVTARLHVVGGKYGGRLNQNKNNQMLIDGCHALGYHVRVAPNNMLQSSVDEKDKGEVGVGDRHGLKQSMVETYLKDGFNTGNVRLLDGVRVNHVLHGRRKQGSGGRQRTVRGVSCQFEQGDTVAFDLTNVGTVVVSGGSLNSPAVLMRTELIG